MNEESTINPKERILQVAYDLFADAGLNGASTRDICSAADVNPAAINYYWGSKEDLWIAVCQHAATWFRQVAARSVDGQMRLDQNLEGIVSALIDALVADPRPIRIVAWASLHAKFHDYRRTADNFRPLVDLLIPGLEGLQKEGHLAADVDVKMAVPLLYGQVVYAFLDQVGHRGYFGLDFSDPDHALRFKRSLLRSVRVVLGLQTESS